jgi:multiple sugar transport system permease protein
MSLSQFLRFSAPAETGNAATGPQPGRRLILTGAGREAMWGYFFIAPWLIGLVVFTLNPILSVVRWSFTNYAILGSPQWVGLQNFEQISVDPLFLKSLYNTGYFVFFRVPIYLLLAFCLALLLNRAGRLIPIFRSLIYLPAVAPVVGLAVVWALLLDPRTGYVNYYLGLLGVPKLNWLTSELLAKPVIVTLSLWSVGIPTMIFLAGLQGVPEQLYEAAEIDGASGWQKLRAITVPMMTPTILLNLVIEIINSFQVFAYAFILTSGGPANATLFYILYIYRHAFEFFQMGYAAALSLILFLIVLALTVVVMKSSDKWVQYERI